jgi:thiol-disulfide isomerase/thioredoxin
LPFFGIRFLLKLNIFDKNNLGMRTLKVWSLIVLAFTALHVFALPGGSTSTAKGLNIKFTVKGLEGSTMILANYYGDKQYIKDTFEFDKKATLTLKADTLLPGGVYLAVFPALNNRYFEFLVDEQQFALETDTQDISKHMKVTGSVQNKLFYDDMYYLEDMRRKSDSLNRLYKIEKDAAKKEALKNQLGDLDKDVKAKREYVIANFPNSFYAKLILAMKEPADDLPKTAPEWAYTAGKLDSSWQWRWYKQNYWKYVDFKDDRIIRSPVYHNKLKTFFNQTTVQQQDSLIASADYILKQAGLDPKNELFKYSLSFMFNEMASTQQMCLDAVYVHLGEEYFCKGYAPWVDSVKMFKICDRVKRLKPNLCGQPAQRLILATDSTETQFKALSDVKSKWTILAFWDPDCGHCKKEIPVLHEAYRNLKKVGVDVTVVSVAINDMDNYKEWQEFVQKNELSDFLNLGDFKRHNNFRWEWDIQSTPQVYVLDSNKIIKARRLSADNVEEYLRMLDDPNFKPKKLTNKVSNTDDKEERLD